MVRFADGLRYALPSLQHPSLPVMEHSLSSAERNKRDVASKERLLGADDAENDSEAIDSYKNLGRPQRCWINGKAVALHFALVLSYTILFFLLARGSFHQRPQEPELIYCTYVFAKRDYRRSLHPEAPARGAITKVRKTLDASVLHSNVYKGSPRPELDSAWKELLRPANIRVSSDMVAEANKTSIPLADGSGYYAILDVYHQLHCLKYIRHYIYDDYYKDTEPWTATHVDHCIDSIRQNLMCNADFSLMTFRWVNDSVDPKPNFEGQHECVDWDKLNDWVEERSFDVDDPSLLIFPGSSKFSES
ncbi:MAG: hypothetical protein M1827_003242 [Pycnora praestabilis]|nr:MAG: hypothetical protein M1827_003242 [Pycnora praestabilis]